MTDDPTKLLRQVLKAVRDKYEPWWAKTLRYEGMVTFKNQTLAHVTIGKVKPRLRLVGYQEMHGAMELLQYEAKQLGLDLKNPYVLLMQKGLMTMAMGCQVGVDYGVIKFTLGNPALGFHPSVKSVAAFRKMVRKALGTRCGTGWTLTAPAEVPQ